MSSSQGNAKIERPPKIRTNVWPWIFFGLIIVFGALGGITGWGATAPLASAVVTGGRVTVDSNRKQIQHLEGGIVAELHVRDGNLVTPGQILIRLDDTRAKASLSIMNAAYREELAKEARFEAERDNLETIEWPAEITENRDHPAVKKLIQSQTSIFASRKETLAGQTDILNERILQLNEEISGLTAQKKSAEKQLSLINEELETLTKLLEQGQATKTRVLALQRETARLEGQHGEFVANIARSKKAIGETKLEIIQRQNTFRTDVVSTLRDVQAKINDIRERRVAAEDVLQRLDIRSPVAGKIVGLNVHAQRAIIRGGDTIMEIVPIDDQLIVEVQVQPQDVDNVAIGQDAELRILAFKRNTPTVSGEVTYLSADALSNPQDGTSFYLARIKVHDEELTRLQGRKLQPGMPAEVMIKTGERTAINYLVKPILESMNRAWREQ